MLSRRVLIIEDDADAAGVLEAYLRRENYDVTITGDGHSGLDMAQRWKPDLILLDVMLPGLNGTEVLAGLRRKSDVPVIMVTAMGDTPDRIGALRYGADDYVVKPVHLDELAARVRALLRRSAGDAAPVQRLGTLELDPANRSARLEGCPLELSPREYALLESLAAHPGRALSRTQLEEAVYGWGEEVASNAIEVHVHHLRRKLGPGWVRTLRGVGYALFPPATPPMAGDEGALP